MAVLQGSATSTEGLPRQGWSRHSAQGEAETPLSSKTQASVLEPWVFAAPQASGVARDQVFPCPLLLSRMQTWPDGFHCCIMKLHEQAHTHSHTEKKKMSKNTPQLYFQLKRKRSSDRPSLTWLTSPPAPLRGADILPKSFLVDLVLFFCIQYNGCAEETLFFHSKQRLMPH